MEFNSDVWTKPHFAVTLPEHSAHFTPLALLLRGFRLTYGASSTPPSARSEFETVRLSAGWPLCCTGDNDDLCDDVIQDLLVFMDWGENAAGPDCHLCGQEIIDDTFHLTLNETLYSVTVTDNIIGSEWNCGFLQCILAKVMPFLPPSDLVTCTFINTGWEIEARNRLLTQKWITLTPQNITDSLNIINVRNNRPRNLYVTTFEYSCGPEVTHFLSNHGHHLINLKIHVSTHFDPKWPQYLEYLSTHLPNLTKLRIVLITWGEITFTNFSPPPGKSCVFWKVRKLGMESPTWASSAHLVKILPLFPNLGALSAEGIDPTVLDKFLTGGNSNLNLPGPIQRTPSITRLELSKLSDNISHYSGILKTVSETLEGIKLFRLFNASPSWGVNEAPSCFQPCHSGPDLINCGQKYI
ncbi:hypothetical protein Fcan01_18036 [Folsomia candida]|uniref:Uncharacterized protein n=1 Tax=Folsomia candida TaxID=158441 RepID=A0A226DSR2_FOLCA|nr:hypothetical protein Fcan01_18036 [Folsomia candida]